MPARRMFLIGAGALATIAGCVDFGESEGDDSEDHAHAAERERAAEPSYHLTAAPVEANDGLEPVLSTDRETVTDLEPLVELITEVTEVFEVTRRVISETEAEAFRELTADVERYFTGNPPGYYFGHEGRRVSVTLGGG